MNWNQKQGLERRTVNARNLFANNYQPILSEQNQNLIGQLFEEMDLYVLLISRNKGQVVE